MDISMEGYLTKEKKTGMKRLSVRYGSKRRWFQLEGHELRYYDSAENANERKHESLRGFINIFDIQSVRKTSSSKSNTFQIVTRRKGSLSLTADSEDVSNEWIESLQLAMRLKRSTVSISEVLKGSVSDEMHANSSDEEFWEKDLSPTQPEEHDMHSTIRDDNDVTLTDDIGDDDVFKGIDRKLSDTNKPIEKDHKDHDTNTATTLPMRHSAAEDGDVLNTKITETCVLRESGYETTEFTDPVDYVDKGTDLTGDEPVRIREVAIDESQSDVEEDGERAVDVLKDLLRHTIVSGIHDDFDTSSREEASNDDKETTDVQETSGIDQLRAMLANELT